MYYFSSKNSKHNAEGIFSFSIPAVETCPGAGACKKICMIKKGNFRFPNVQEGYKKRFELSKSKNFVPALDNELKTRKIKGQCIKKVRWHVSGDVYNQQYLNKLIKIAKLNPEISFFLYTKSLHLKWDVWNSLDNTVMIASEGGKYPIDMSRPHARIFKTVADIPADYVNCNASDLLAFQTAKTGSGKIALILK